MLQLQNAHRDSTRCLFVNRHGAPGRRREIEKALTSHCMIDPEFFKNEHHIDFCATSISMPAHHHADVACRIPTAT